MRHIAAAFLFLAPLALFGQDAPTWLRYPAISPDGAQIAFSYQGDLYVVPTAGGTAVQRTTYSGYDAMPVWSPDGSHIAFASDRYGNLDVFVIPAAGGTPTRLTHHSATDHPSDFTPDGQHVLFTSSRTDKASNAMFPSGVLSELYQVSVAGGTPQMVLTTPAEDAVYNAEGTALLFHDRKGYEDPLRKKHTSSVTRDVWRYDMADSSYTKVAGWQGEDRTPVWDADETGFFYLSEASNGTFNVHHKPFDGAPTALTDFPIHPVRFLTSSADGLLCFSQDGEIYTMRRGESPQKVAVRLTRDASRTDAIQTVSSGATQMAVSPNGKEIAFIYRGDVFVTSTETSTTKQVTQTPTQERSVAFHPKGRTLVYAGERDGTWNLYESSIARDDEPYFYTATLIDETPLLVSDTATFQPAYSPDGSEVAYLEDRTTIKVIDRASKVTRTVVPGTHNFSYADGDQHFEWSPDGKWLLIEYTQPGYWPSEVGLVKADGTGEIVNLTQSGYPDSSPQWMMGGKMMLWFSDRNGLRGWAGSSAREVDAYGMFFTEEAFERFSLSKEDFDLLKEREAKEKKEEKEDEDKDESPRSDSTKTIEIDLDGIEDRQARLTIHSARMNGAVVTPDGGKLVYLARFEKGFDLWVTDLRTRETKILAKLGAGFASIELSADGKHVFLLSGGRFSKVAIEGGKRTSIAYSSEMVLDAPAEREYIFWHAWQQSIDKFYDPTLHGIRAQWDSLGHAHARHLPHIANGYDFRDLLGELLGELNASHSGARYTHRSENGDATASLGVFYDTEYTGKGVRIAEVMKDGPLDNADSEIEAGTVIEMIDGTALTPKTNLYSLLNRKAGDRVRLSLIDPATQESWEEVIKPISLGAESQLRYDRWVKQRRALVDSLSGGRLGYVHVRSMSDGSYRTVIEEVLGRHVTKEALVVDTRFNGGGDLVDDLSTFLTGTRYADFISPDGRVIGTEPQRRWHKPSVMLMSEGNYSDAHCTPYAYKALGIGQLVGMPVPGTCSFVWWERQIDSSIRFGLPNMAMTDKAQRPLENLQLEPDVRVENLPAATAAGDDAQLQRAVEVLLDTLPAAN
ncbi:MAG: S41 family peptidase [Bacteroidota bacterium]